MYSRTSQAKLAASQSLAVVASSLAAMFEWVEVHTSMCSWQPVKVQQQVNFDGHHFSQLCRRNIFYAELFSWFADFSDSFCKNLVFKFVCCCPEFGIVRNWNTPIFIKISLIKSPSERKNGMCEQTNNCKNKWSLVLYMDS